MSDRLANRRIRLLLAALGLLLAVALGRSAWLQTVRSNELDRQAASQQERVIRTKAHRGTIYDRRSRELAIAERGITVYANPRTIEKQGVDASLLARLVAADLDLEETEVYAQLTDTSRGFVYLKRKADPDAADALRQKLAASDLVGIDFDPEDKRVYPQRRIAAAVVGFVRAHDNEGLEGLEAGYERQLSGREGTRRVLRDPGQRTIGVIAQEPVQEGDDLYLTLDHRLQAEAERIARVTRANWGAKAVTIVAYDPATGGVLAMASEPGFDANEPPDPSTGRLKNRAVTDLYEPGSTYKVVTVAAALEERVARPSSRYVLAPEIQVGDKIIREAHARPAVTYSLREIVAQSSNVGVATIARNLGRRRLADWVERFGFGAKTGIDFPGESPGLVLPLDDWSDSTIGTVPIGQGIGVTSVQMVALYGTIANGGVWVQPHLVDRIEGAGARVFQPRKRRVVSARTARELSRMLEGVVTRGTATTAAIPGYSVAGKTGTALVPKPGGYWKGRYIASFVGFLPARKPRLVILVKVDEPKSGFYGGTVAAPAFAEFGRFAARYLEIPPDRPLSGSA